MRLDLRTAFYQQQLVSNETYLARIKLAQSNSDNPEWYDLIIKETQKEIDFILSQLTEYGTLTSSQEMDR